MPVVIMLILAATIPYEELDVSVVILFYIAFLSQIYLISYHYPMRLRQRILYVFNHYPPADYPKLYPQPYDYYAKEAQKGGLRAFRNINFIIIGIGLAVLAAAANAGYSPSLQGGDEIFVMAYFMLQICPLIYVELANAKLYKRMREVQKGGVRKASMQPRHLFDFIAPVYVGIAGFVYLAWLTLFIADRGLNGPWTGEVYGTVFGITGIHVFYGLMIAKHIVGKKVDPHQDSEDRAKATGFIVKSLVFSSIAMNLFITFSILADRYDFELYDPLMTSIFVQCVAALGIGYVLRVSKIDAINFNVYKKDTASE
ncbi:MAG: hypothetical protein COB37_02630 [Kordiimonadales bacterium]|nr:MAG: hypothetical protein COB37_02630 [Kordiimonadales bacterium]